MGWFTEKNQVETSPDKKDKKSGVWGSQLASAMSDARKNSSSAEKGAKGKSKNSADSDTGGDLSQQAKEAVRKMFDPEAWRAIVRSPFSFGKAVTGRECWELDKKQEDTLATSTSLTAEYFLQTDPKWVALTLFAFNWSVILTEKFALNAKERKKEDELNPKPKEVVGIHMVHPNGS